MTTDFTVEFSGESEIDLNALLVSLLNFGTAIQEIQSGIEPNAKVDIKVKPFGEGSFLVYLALNAPDIFNGVRPLFTVGNLTVVENILSVFSNTLNLKKFLGGKPPKDTKQSDDGQNITIEHQNGNTFQIKTEVFNLYVGNPKIDASYSKAFAALEKEDGVTGLKILDHNKSEVSDISKDVFPEMSQPFDNYRGDTNELVKDRAFIQAVRLSFDESLASSFVYEGNRINAKITDNDFYKRVNANERFAKGDVLEVNLKIIQKFDASVNTYLNHAYEVIKVINITEAPIQGNLFEQ